MAISEITSEAAGKADAYRCAAFQISPGRPFVSIAAVTSPIFYHFSFQRGVAVAVILHSGYILGGQRQLRDLGA